jgi:uncharacterized protein DUF4160
MPTVLRVGPYRFYFYPADGSEPRHVHVNRDDYEVKFWLDPVRLGFNRGFSQRELRDIERLVVQNLNQLRTAWDAYFTP